MASDKANLTARAKAVYRKDYGARPCLLFKEDLPRLEAVIRDNFPPSERTEDFKISSNLDDMTISASTMHDFLSHKELPDSINALSITGIGWNQDGAIDKSVDLTFYHNFINLRVSGDNQTWVLGKFSQICDFLERKKPWFWRLNLYFPQTSGITLVLASLAAGLLFRVNLIYSAACILFVFANLWATRLYFKGTFLPYVSIILRPRRSFLTKENITIVILVGTLLATLASVILSLVHGL